MSATTLAPLSLLALVGLRAVAVPHLGRDAWLVPEAGVLLMDASLDRDGVVRVVDEAVARSLDLAVSA
jgi:hypothetical protein